MNANCQTINHSPICSCHLGHSGDPFTRCFPIPRKNVNISDSTTSNNQFYVAPLAEARPVITNPCIPSPCGPYSQCRDIGGAPSCSCLPKYIGSPPNCRPECIINSECSSNMACINEKCRDPCAGSCGAAAQCNVINHTPICTCPVGYIGDPFTFCGLKPQEIESVAIDPCNPTPCGPNAECRHGICTCLTEYHGDPYIECRPECVLNNDCPREKACIRNKCLDPCPGTCGTNAVCSMINHIPMCSCLTNYEGNAFIMCNPIPGIYFKIISIFLLQ